MKNKKIETLIFLIFSFFINYFSYGVKRDIYYVLIAFILYFGGGFLIFELGDIIRKNFNKKK